MYREGITEGGTVDVEFMGTKGIEESCGAGGAQGV
jgi:hypothetical protein